MCSILEPEARSSSESDEESTQLHDVRAQRRLQILNAPMKLEGRVNADEILIEHATIGTGEKRLV